MARRQNDALRRQLAERVRELRVARGLTQEQLAEAAGAYPETISRVETGALMPSIPTAQSIAQGLGVALGHLLDADAPVDDSERRLVRAWRALSEDGRASVWGCVQRESRPAD